MKKLLSIILAVVVTLCIAAPAMAADVTADLITDGGDISTATDIGDLDVTYNGDVFTIEYFIDLPWEIVETHVYIGSEPPAKHSPGKFPYEAGDITFYSTGEQVYIAAHAEVRMDTGEVDELGNPVYLYETVWAQTDTNFPIGKGANWATYFEFPTAVG